MVMGYWSVAILFLQLSIDHIVNVQCKRCGFTKTRLRHPSLPFDSIPYPTRTITICRRVHGLLSLTILIDFFQIAVYLTLFVLNGILCLILLLAIISRVF